MTNYKFQFFLLIIPTLKKGECEIFVNIFSFSRGISCRDGLWQKINFNLRKSFYGTTLSIRFSEKYIFAKFTIW